MENQITCPHCQQEINVEEVLIHSIEDRYETKYKIQEKELAEKFTKKEKAIAQQEGDLKAKEQEINLLIEERASIMTLEKEAKIKEATKKEFEVELNDYKNQVGEYNNEINGMKQLLLELRRANRVAEKQKEDLKLEFEDQKEVYANQKMKEVQEKEEAKTSLKVREKELLIEQLSSQLIEAQKRISQGSQERQGEAQEVELEKLLTSVYPFDKITEIGRGQNGADVIQEVFSILQKKSGSIMYESKRTKKFSKDWISKAKKDMIDRGTDLAVIVTEALPDNWIRFGLIDGIWVCSFLEVEAVSLILREMLLRIGDVEIAQENKGTKMQYLYDYLTSSEFARLMTGIVEGFTSMHDQLESEKRSITAIWKKREKQIQVVAQNAIDLYGSIKAIAGSDLANMPQLELSDELELN